MAFSVDFGKIREVAGDLVQSGASQAKKLGNIAKLKSDNLAQKDTLRKAYQALGQQYYALHGSAPEEEMTELCAKIAAAMEAIGANNAQLAELKTKDGVVDVTVDVTVDDEEAPAEEVPAEEAPAEEAPAEEAQDGAGEE